VFKTWLLLSTVLTGVAVAIMLETLDSIVFSLLFMQHTVNCKY